MTELKERILETLQSVYDPEIPVNIYDLGLIYDVQVGESNNTHISMTLTSPSCPVAGSLPGEVQTRVAAIPGIGAVNVELTFNPPWDKSRMSEVALYELGFL